MLSPNLRTSDLSEGKSPGKANERDPLALPEEKGHKRGSGNDLYVGGPYLPDGPRLRAPRLKGPRTIEEK